MAQHLDLEEQEQLDQLKHFWKQYGNALTWALIVVMGAFAAWNFYQYWQRSQAAQAAALFDEVERAVQVADAEKMQRVLSEMSSRFGSSVYAQQSALLVAKQLFALGKTDAARSALMVVAEKPIDPGYQAMARLRLAALALQANQIPEALKWLEAPFDPAFAALAADRRGDALALQGQRDAAIAEYQKAYAQLDARSSYRRWVEIKLNQWGIDPTVASGKS
ncbi:MAG: tetratricopeptide repeat protein [Rhodoferax sp.]